MSQNTYVHSNTIPAGALAQVQAFLSGASVPNIVGFGNESIHDVLNAALIAEDIATCFYYLGLTSSGVTSDPGFSPDVQSYFAAALGQEIAHAAAIRKVLGVGGTWQYDPVTTFYFNPTSFSSLWNFLQELDYLENVFIAAYRLACAEATALAAYAGGLPNLVGNTPAWFYQDLADTAASIMFVEGEHRVLGQIVAMNCTVIPTADQGNSKIGSITVGPDSAVAALQKYVTGTGSYTEQVSLQSAVQYAQI